MSAIRFFQVSLLLPFIVVTLCLLPARLFFPATLLDPMQSYVWGIYAYLLFAVFLGIYLDRIASHRSLLLTVWTAPLLFLPVQILNFLSVEFFHAQHAAHLDQLVNAVTLISGYTLVFGYASVAFAMAIFCLLLRVGWVHRHERPNSALQGARDEAARL